MRSLIRNCGLVQERTGLAVGNVAAVVRGEHELPSLVALLCEVERTNTFAPPGNAGSGASAGYCGHSDRRLGRGRANRADAAAVAAAAVRMYRSYRCHHRKGGHLTGVGAHRLGPDSTARPAASAKRCYAVNRGLLNGNLLHSHAAFFHERVMAAVSIPRLKLPSPPPR